MPTYQYACTACDHEFEVVQAFTDSSLTECPQCGGKLRKLFGAVGVVFKGDGFYRTDSRKKPETASSSSSTKSTDSSTSTSSPKAETSPKATESKPSSNTTASAAAAS